MPRNLREVFSAWDDSFKLTSIPKIVVNDLHIDSRQVQAGDVFVAVPGKQSHGLGFVEKAIVNGASAVLCDLCEAQNIKNCTFPVILIPDLNKRLAELASRFYGVPGSDMLLVAVTGTNGKTSVAHFIAQAWQLWRGNAGLIGTLGAGPLNNLNETSHTTPDIFEVYSRLASLRAAGIGLTAMEVSSHALDQNRIGRLSFDVGIFTNLSHDHLDYHGDMQRYGLAKKRLFTEHKPRFAVLNVADKVGRQWQGELSENTECLSYYGDSATDKEPVGGYPPADIYASDVKSTDRGIGFYLHSPWGQAKIQSKLLGRFNLDNLLATVAALGLLGMPFKQLCQALELVQPVIGRMQRIGTELDQPLVVIDYAHTPDALKQALLSLRPHTHGQLYCIFGCGGERDRSKRPLMAAVTEKYADQVFLTSDNPRSEDALKIIDEISSGFSDPGAVRIEPDRAAAIRLAVYAADKQDIILIAGKGHEQYQQLGTERLPFDDAAEARLALGIAA
ncbi:MAG: UDP-N-acetylmuramoyl-L-alanyl-D-glutamate--2,6-diaminopimelate ligase [Proteobacteria bacterium]|nr:UDP-N-acetylmuramoyl-L-alanyl-D-glutamate--2,6-diaminopimelate ligase [Pseudomonadota bacterium]